MEENLIPRMRPGRGYYVLDENGNAREEADFYAWLAWNTKNAKSRDIAQTTVCGVFVSTVFLGLDHDFGRFGRTAEAAKLHKPILWETMVFNMPNEDDMMRRYSSAIDARNGHEDVVREVRRALLLRRIKFAAREALTRFKAWLAAPAFTW